MKTLVQLEFKKRTIICFVVIISFFICNLLLATNSNKSVIRDTIVNTVLIKDTAPVAVIVSYALMQDDHIQNCVLRIKNSSATVPLTFGEYVYFRRLIISDIEYKDGIKEILIEINVGDCADVNTYIYRYNGSELYYIGDIPGEFNTENGFISVQEWAFIGIFSRNFAVNNEPYKIEEKREDYYKFSIYGEDVTAISEFSLHLDKSLNSKISYKVRKNEKLIFDIVSPVYDYDYIGDKEFWFHIIGERGEGWIKSTEDFKLNGIQAPC